jgi:NADPH:quinone reductase-like Zn-dependent oxidoreductase
MSQNQWSRSPGRARSFFVAASVQLSGRQRSDLTTADSSFLAKRSKEDLHLLKELIEAGNVTPVIDRTYSLSEVPDAIRNLEAGHARGKQTCLA